MAEQLCCLNLIVSPEAEENLLDLLLVSPETRAFTSMQVAGHGADPGRWSTAEQVLGRNRRMQVQLIVSREAADTLLDRLRAELPGAGIFYWLTAVEAMGEIR